MDLADTTSASLKETESKHSRYEIIINQLQDWKLNTKFLQFQTLATTTYVANMMFIKLSIGVFLLRIAVQKRYIWTLKISMVIITVWSLASTYCSKFPDLLLDERWRTTLEHTLILISYSCGSGKLARRQL